MTSDRMDLTEEEALCRSYPYAALYFVQSPTTTVSFHSPATQRRLVLSHYSSSRGSTTSFLHDHKKTLSGPQDSPEHAGIGGEAPEMGEEKCCDYVGGKNVDGGVVGGDGAESEEEEEEEEEDDDFERKRGLFWRLFTFRESDSWVWICLQISLRAILSFWVAVLFFYLITKPPPPIISLQMEKMSEFRLGEGVDNTGVATKILTCNCSLNLHVQIKSLLFGLHIHPPVLTMSFINLPLASSRGSEELYAKANGPTTFSLYIGTRDKPMYGAGRSMQDILQTGKGLPLTIRVMFRSRYHVVGKLISPKFKHKAECLLVLHKIYDQKRKTVLYTNQCNML